MNKAERISDSDLERLIPIITRCRQENSTCNYNKETLFKDIEKCLQELVKYRNGGIR